MAVHAAYDAILGDLAQADGVLQYSVSEGDPDLGAWIAAQMRGRGVDCTSDNILITSGSQQVLEFPGKAFQPPGDTALVAARGRHVRLGYVARGVDAAQILPRAVAEQGIAFVPGHAFHADGRGRNTMRLSFSLPAPDAIREGMARLKRALQPVA